MKNVSKQEFFNFFKNRTDVSAYAETSKIWIVSIRGTAKIIAKAIEDSEGEEKYFILN